MPKCESNPTISLFCTLMQFPTIMHHFWPDLTPNSLISGQIGVGTWFTNANTIKLMSEPYDDMNIVTFPMKMYGKMAARQYFPSLQLDTSKCLHTHNVLILFGMDL